MLKGKTEAFTGCTAGNGPGIAVALAARGVRILLNGFGEAATSGALLRRSGDRQHTASRIVVWATHVAVA